MEWRFRGMANGRVPHLSAVKGCGQVAEVAGHAIQLEEQLQSLLIPSQPPRHWLSSPYGCLTRHALPPGLSVLIQRRQGEWQNERASASTAYNITPLARAGVVTERVGAPRSRCSPTRRRSPACAPSPGLRAIRLSAVNYSC